MRQDRRWQTAVEAPLGLFAFLDLPESALEQAPPGAEGGGAGFSVLLLPQEQHCHTNNTATAQTRAEGAGGEPEPQRWALPFPRAQGCGERGNLSPALIRGLKFIHTDVFRVKRLPRRSFLILKAIPRAICLHTKYFPSVVPASVRRNRPTETSPKTVCTLRERFCMFKAE